MNGLDDMVWDVLKHSFCKFKVKQVGLPVKFCRNWYNLTGVCNCKLCPLANSQYATVLEKEGKIFLCIKTVERAHLPKKLWENIELSRNMEESIRQINENLQWWPRLIINKCKSRLLRIKEYLARRRQLKLHPGMKIVRINKKEERQLKGREIKAERMAKLDLSIEKELLQRLRSGVYDSEIPINIPDSAFLKVIDKELDKEEKVERAKTAKTVVKDKGLRELRDVEDIYEAAESEDEYELDMDNDSEAELEGEEGEEDDDDEDELPPQKGGKRPHVNVGKREPPPVAKRPKQEIEIEREEVALRSLIDW